MLYHLKKVIFSDHKPFHVANSSPTSGGGATVFSIRHDSDVYWTLLYPTSDWLELNQSEPRDYLDRPNYQLVLFELKSVEVDL